jgi:hypothetical protein
MIRQEEREVFLLQFREFTRKVSSRIFVFIILDVQADITTSSLMRLMLCQFLAFGGVESHFPPVLLFYFLCEHCGLRDEDLPKRSNRLPLSQPQLLAHAFHSSEFGQYDRRFA